MDRDRCDRARGGPERGVLPFGRPARDIPRSARPADVLVLGAYPSALHIQWAPPDPFKPIKALAVDVEPEPFWNGSDEAERVRAWKHAVGWRAEWGSAGSAGRLNGSSGVWVDEHVLAPLGCKRGDAWITDCLHWYCASTGAAARIADTYAPFASERGLPAARLPAHPSEHEIVRAAIAHELPRLATELRAAAPALVVTLGNAALRVMREMVGDLPAKLSPDAEYGRRHRTQFEGRAFDVLPLAHPAAPRVYQDAHQRWCEHVGAADRAL